VVTARSPRGPWSDPVWLEGDGIDPSLAFLDGRVYLTRNGRGSDPDHPFVYQAELVSDGHGLTQATRPRVIWKGAGGVWPEAPHVYRRGGWYYLVTAEGGTSYGHSVVVARGRTPYGPFVASPHGPLLTHRNRPRHPVQATGHADLVDLDDGSTWAVLLGIRPHGGRHHHLGRETFLAPVAWDDDGWPRMSGLALRMEGPPLPRRAQAELSEHVDFSHAKLPKSFAFVRNPLRGSWSLVERPGFLRLWGHAASLTDSASPALVCRRQQHFEMAAATRLTFEPRHENEQAGICVRANEGFHVALLVTRDHRGRRELRLVRTLAGRQATLGRALLGSGPVALEVEATHSQYVFSGGTGPRLHELGHVRTRALSAETILERTQRHHFTGAVIGLLATGAGRRSTVPADFGSFDYASTAERAASEVR
jgi:alpha-N-arabinofuranosidase